MKPHHPTHSHKHLLKQKAEILVPEHGGGMSKEVHLINFNKERYILRKCQNKKRADRYQEISIELKKYNILPKLLYRDKNKLLFEYIKGRDLKLKDANKVAYEIGKICGIVTKIKIGHKYNFNEKFYKKLIYLKNRKVLTNLEFRQIKEKYKKLIRKIKPQLRVEIDDITPNNFRLSKGKIYLVDIEAIKYQPKGICFGKSFLKWFKTPKQKEKFQRGFNSVSSSRFLNKQYQEFIYLYFLINNIYGKVKRGDSIDINLKRINQLI